MYGDVDGSSEGKEASGTWLLNTYDHGYDTQCFPGLSPKELARESMVVYQATDANAG